jgi:hypothetical protein
MNPLYQVAVRVTAVLMVPATFTIGGVAYAAFQPVAPPPKPTLDLVVPLPLPPPPPRLDLDKIQTLTTWSVIKHVPAPPAPSAEPEKTWTCEPRPVVAGRLGDEVRLVGAQTVGVCEWR